MPDIDAWRTDSEGHFVDMNAGARKDYSLDCTDLLGAEDLAAAEISLPAGITLAGNPEINGKVVKFYIHANGAAGKYSCSALISGSGTFVETIPFRVVVR